MVFSTSVKRGALLSLLRCHPTLSDIRSNFKSKQFKVPNDILKTFMTQFRSQFSSSLTIYPSSRILNKFQGGILGGGDSLSYVVFDKPLKYQVTSESLADIRSKFLKVFEAKIHFSKQCPQYLVQAYINIRIVDCLFKMHSKELLREIRLYYFLPLMFYKEST